MNTVFLIVCGLAFVGCLSVWLCRQFKGIKGETEFKKLPDISEPVISFVECVRNNRKRFKVERIVSFDREVIGVVRDTVHNEEFKVRGSHYKYIGDLNFIYQKPDMITNDEVLYVYNELTSIYNRYQKVIDTRKKVVAERKARDERKRLIGVYCNET